MKTITLQDVIKQELKSDPAFSEHYRREQLINAIAKMVFEARCQAQLTQAELAKRTGTTQPVIARIENGNDSRIPSLDLLMRIAQAAHMKLNLQFQA